MNDGLGVEGGMVQLHLTRYSDSKGSNRLGMALKGNRGSLVGEFDDNVNGPRTVFGQVSTAARVVLGTSSPHVCIEAGVVLGRTLVVRENVHETPRRTSGPGNQLAVMNDADSGELLQTFAKSGNAVAAIGKLTVASRRVSGRYRGLAIDAVRLRSRN